MERSLNDEKMYTFFKNEAKEIFAEFSLHTNEVEGIPVCQMTKEGISKIYKGLQVIYDKKDAVEEACLIENIYEILNRFIKIKGMEHLLVNNYAVLENGIFLEHSAEGAPKRIREHYKHQFRNAYLGLLLLKDFHFDDCIADCVMDKKNEYAYFILTALAEKLEVNKRHMLKEIIYKSYFISALFHDIGYPLAYYFRTADEMHHFAPFFKIVNPTVKIVFAEINAVLNNSWLFQTVAHDEIRKKYEKNDHGCLSAISFLMNFYFSGSIYSMDAGKQCIVEMAAVSIYKHTNHYDKNNRMLFTQDPISYFLRMCDDLQEWQRFLVCIEKKHNYLQCVKCGKIIRQSGKDGSYQCECGKQFRKITQMENKKMNYINICSGMRLEGDEHKLHIYIQYGCYQLLELLLSDYESVIDRDKGLKDVNYMLQPQSYLPNIQLHYFLSNNPTEIIEEMKKQSEKSVDDIWKWIGSQKNEADLREFINICADKLEKQEFGEKIEQNIVKYADVAKKFTEQYLGEIYSLWRFLEV